jgi:hypothetical protein
MGLQSFFKDTENQKKSLLYTAATAIGLIVLIYLFKGAFSFSSAVDTQIADMLNQGQDKTFGLGFIEALKEDRMDLFSSDLLRSGFFMAITFGVMWFYLKGKLMPTTAVVIIGIFMVGDLFFIDKNYVSNDGKQFRSAREIDQPFEVTEADNKILQDNSVFRVYELQRRLQGRTSYFHKSVGGYSAVRPRRYEQLFDYQIDRQLNDLGKIIDPQTMTLTKSIPIMNALNIKYLLLQTNDGESVAVTNPFINGNAWFVTELKTVNTADEEMKVLGKIDTKNTATISASDEVTAKLPKSFTKDSLATIKLEEHLPNAVKYTSNNNNDGFAVFSENFYQGWKATIDGKDADIQRVNYVQRGLFIPKGKHTIEFKFEPQVIKTGSTIALVSSILMVLAIVGVVYFERKNNKA